MRPTDIVVVGKIQTAHGLRGLLKVRSFTDPPNNFEKYSDCYISKNTRSDWRASVISSVSKNGNSFLVEIENITNREQALAIKSELIGVGRDKLEEVGSGEYYWTDLVGCSVENGEGFQFGKVDRLIETGSNDVMEISGTQGKRLIPFSGDYLVSVDIDQRLIVVVWEPDWN
jgi:16S rRNA processing protein RimM